MNEPVTRADSAILLDLVALFDESAKNFDCAFAFADAFDDLMPEIVRALARPCDGKRYVGNAARVLMAALDEIISGSPETSRQTHFRTIAFQAAAIVRNEAAEVFRIERSAR